MPRRVNTHGGGAQTNANGLSFEQTTSLNAALEKEGYTISGCEVYLNGTKVGLSVPKYALYSQFLEKNGIDYSIINSKKWLPDEAFINLSNKTVYIIEKKFQNSSGSVDEKLGGCEFKKQEYIKLCQPLGYNVEYIYIFNDWFKDPQYTDILNYIRSKNCFVFYNKSMPLSALGL